MTKAQALATAQAEFGQYQIYVRSNEVIVRDQQDNKLVTKISFTIETQPNLPGM